MYRTYCSCDCKGRLYIGYTSKPEDSDYMGSYSDETFEPKHSFTLSRHADKAVALLQESGLQRAWGIPGNKRFANKARATAGHYLCHGELKGEEHPMYGKKHTDEARARMSAALQGEKHPMYGKKPTDETRERISAANKGKKPTYATKARISAANKGRKHTDEAKARISAANKGKKYTQATKARISATKLGENNPMYGKKKSDLTRLRNSIATTISRAKTKNITQAVLQRLEQKLAQLKQKELATEGHTSEAYERYSIAYAEMCSRYTDCNE